MFSLVTFEPKKLMSLTPFLSKSPWKMLHSARASAGNASSIRAAGRAAVRRRPNTLVIFILLSRSLEVVAFFAVDHAHGGAAGNDGDVVALHAAVHGDAAQPAVGDGARRVDRDVELVRHQRRDVLLARPVQ